MAKTSNVVESVDWKILKLAGKQVHFSGKFDPYSTDSLECLKESVVQEGATVADRLTAKVAYLVLNEPTGLSATEKRAADFNSKGASITVLSPPQLRALLLPANAEAHAMLIAGPEGRRLFAQRVNSHGFSFRELKYEPKLPFQIRNIDLSGQDLSVAPLVAVDLQKSDLSNAVIRATSNDLPEVGFLKQCNLNGAKMAVDVRQVIDCSGQKADLSDSVFGEASAAGKPRRPPMRGDFTNAKLVGCRFFGTDISGSIFDNADLSHATIWESTAKGVSFRSACLKGFGVSKMELAKVDFSGADLSECEFGMQTTLVDCNLTNASLKNAFLMGCRFRGCCLDGADFTGANLAQADFTGVDTSKAIGLVKVNRTVAAGSTLKQLSDLLSPLGEFSMTIEVQQGKGRVKFSLRRNSWNIVARWTRCLMGEKVGNLRPDMKSLSDAVVDFVNLFPEAVPQLQTIEVESARCNLPPPELLQLVIEAWCETFGTDCPKADQLQKDRLAFEKEQEKRSTKFLEALKKPDGVARWNKQVAFFKHTLESKKWFPFADLERLKLDGADFSGMRFTSGKFNRSSLLDTNIDECEFEICQFVGASLKISPRKSRFQQCNFSNATLSGSDLSNSDLCNSTFCKAKLQDVDLSAAKLQGVDFTGSKLDWCNLKDAEFDEVTRFPQGFEIPAKMKWTGKGVNPRAAQLAAGSGPISLSRFMSIIEASVDADRLKKALAMLRAERFELFADAKEDYLVGVVKSQNDPERVYSCRLSKAGEFACCTQNLNPCGGLRGAPCKHLLVLIIGMTKSDKLDPTVVNKWLIASRNQKPVLDKDLMSETLLRFKGAEAGEIDWRPMETIPEDYFV